eukprot:COSAG06_NODE_24953_length_648_cov_1.477231_2_plen_22_part_01
MGRPHQARPELSVLDPQRLGFG